MGRGARVACRRKGRSRPSALCRRIGLAMMQTERSSQRDDAWTSLRSSWTRPLGPPGYPMWGGRPRMRSPLSSGSRGRGFSDCWPWPGRKGWSRFTSITLSPTARRCLRPFASVSRWTTVMWCRWRTTPKTVPVTCRSPVPNGCRGSSNAASLRPCHWGQGARSARRWKRSAGSTDHAIASSRWWVTWPVTARPTAMTG